MSVADSHHQGAAAAALQRGPTPGARILRYLWRLIVVATFAAAVTFAAGFLWFVGSVPSEEVSIDRPADGIVVLTGGVIGGVAAMLLFLVAGFFGDRFKGTAGEEQVTALFGSFSIGIVGYAAIVALIVLIGVVTAGASRLTVYRTLGSIE